MAKSLCPCVFAGALLLIAPPLSMADDCELLFYVEGLTLRSARTRNVAPLAGQVAQLHQVQASLPSNSLYRGTYHGADAIIDPLDSYVPGASLVIASGRIVDIDVGRARLLLGTLWVDYSSLLGPDPQLEFIVGDCVRFSGIQPLRNGDLLAGAMSLEASSGNPEREIIDASISPASKINSYNAIIGTNGIIGGGRKK
jgi:hypothetical protein